MYDIKIFIEENWQFWARLNIWKDVIYWIWNNQEELMNDLKQGLELVVWDSIDNWNIKQIYSYLSYTKKDYAIKI